MEKRTSKKAASTGTKRSKKTERDSGADKKKTNKTSAEKKTAEKKKSFSFRMGKKISPHKSFKRTYREDYQRDLNVPGVMEHIARSFEMLFRNWRVFLPLLGVAVVISLLTMGTSGILDEVTGAFGAIVFLIIWLTTIFLVRHIKAGHKVTVRDGLYNAMTPLISTGVVLIVALVQCVPIFLLIIAYSAAVQTHFLSTPFYALVFFVFAAVMVLISGYFLSSSLIALVAVSAPGLYPLRALSTATELMMGRRVRFVLRLVALLIIIVLMWAAVVLPLSALNLPQAVLVVIEMIMACFTGMYATVYLYLYYRWMLDA